MPTLLLLRHGQAAFGTDHYDRLSPLGARQADATGAFLAERGWRFDRVLCGPRQRQRDTAAGVVRRLGAQDISTLAALDEFADGDQVLAVARERAFPAPLEGADRMRHYMATVQGWADGRIEIPHAPTAARFLDDATRWLHGLQAECPAGQRLLAVTSAGTMAALACAAFGLPASRMADFMAATHNAALTEIAFTRERSGVRSFNGAGHLPAELLTLM